MNWGHWVAQCQWDAACRALLLRHPHFGIATANIAYGSKEGYTDGWNKVVPRSVHQPPTYVFIGKKHGWTTSEPPTDQGDGPINEVEAPPVALTESHLWGAFVRSGDNLVSHGGGPPELVYRIRHRMIAATAMVDSNDAALRGITMIRDAWRRSEDGPVGVDELDAPILQWVHAYMGLEVVGELASQVMSSLLFTLCSIPRVRFTSEQLTVNPLVEAVEHLTAVISELLERRNAMNVPSYMRATYLTGLYAGVVLHLVRRARRRRTEGGAWPDWAPLGAAEVERLVRLELNVDEMNAHRIAPTFVLPALFTPLALVNRLDAMAASSECPTGDWAEFYQIDPAYRLMLSSRSSWREATNQEAAEQHHAMSDSLQDFNVDEALRGSSSPLSKRNRQELMLTLLANQPWTPGDIGQGRP